MDLYNSEKNSDNPLAKKQKLKLFLVFFFVSTLFWGVTKFSNNYSALVLFSVKYINVPELIIIQPQYKLIEGYVNASGFQLFFYRFFRKTLNIDFSSANLNDGNGSISLVSLRRSLDDQIFGSFLSFENEKLFFGYSSYITKKVPVKVDQNSEFNIASGFSSLQDSSFEPDSINVSGPKSKLEDLDFIPVLIKLNGEISKNIEMTVRIQDNDSSLKFNPNNIVYRESIEKFTEQSFDINLKLINVPDSVKIKLFPKNVKLYSSFPFQFVNNINNEDFELIFDYLDTKNGKFQSIPVRLNKFPDFSKNIRWEPKTISYLVKK